jgi:hypothetical protein
LQYDCWKSIGRYFEIAENPRPVFSTDGWVSSGDILDDAKFIIGWNILNAAWLSKIPCIGFPLQNP